MKEVKFYEIKENQEFYYMNSDDTADLMVRVPESTDETGFIYNVINKDMGRVEYIPETFSRNVLIEA